MGRLSEKIKSARTPFVSAVIVAGGSGRRFGADKLMAELGGMPVLARTLLQFEQAELVDEIIVVARDDAIAEVVNLCRRYRIAKTANVVPGGETRLLSSLNGAAMTSKRAGIVAIHDGARPLVTDKIIEDAIWAAHLHQAAVPAVPVKDTVKIARERIVVSTPERESLFAVQTPQCFQRDLILGALVRASELDPGVTDDCMAFERMGGQVWLTDGSEENLKITTPLDLELAELILKRRNGA